MLSTETQSKEYLKHDITTDVQFGNIYWTLTLEFDRGNINRNLPLGLVKKIDMEILLHHGSMCVCLGRGGSVAKW